MYTRRLCSCDQASATGLYWMRMRHYSPQLGRSLQPDPAGIAGGINLYAYSNNNPLRYFDPWGLWPAPDATGSSDGKYGEADPSRYRRISRWIHGVLSAAGVVPLLGVIPDTVDLLYTLAELPSGHSSGTDAALAALGVAATFAPGAGDGAAAAAKIANRALDAGEVIAKNADVAADAASAAAKNLPTPNYAPGSHTTFRSDPQTGRVTHYETRVPQTNPQNPNPWQVEKRFDGTGRGHYNKAMGQEVPTPHVNDPSCPGGVRPPYPDELPTGY